MQNLDGKKVLIMATSGFEESELTGPRKQLGDAGALVHVAAPTMDEIQATKSDEWTIKVKPDLTVGNVTVADYDALILPGGVINPDQLRTNAEAVEVVRKFDEAGKPVAAICHGPWMLVEADVLRGRKATSWPSIRTDLRNAGAQVVDEAACVDGNLITSRNPDDVDAFSEAIADAMCLEHA